MGLTDLIDLVYAAAADPEAWPAALDAIAEALQARAMSLTIADPTGGSAPIVVAPRSDPQWLRVYAERWAMSNVVRERGYSLPLGAVYGFEDLDVPREVFERSDFYNEFWAPQRLNFALITLTAKDAEAISAAGFYRATADGPFDATAKQLLRRLGPHLRRAVSLSLRLGQSEMRRDSMVAMLDGLSHGALMVDARGRVLFANAPAEALLTEESSLRLRDGVLATRGASTTAALFKLIAGGLGGNLCVTAPDGATLELEVMPVPRKTQWSAQRPAAFVLVRSPKAAVLPSYQQIQSLFGCTRAQALLARELLHGDGIPAAAARLGVSRSTARTHLLELFHKTGTNRQAELVRLILQRLPYGEAARGAAPPQPPTTGGRRLWRDVASRSAAALAVGGGLLEMIAR